MSNTWVFYGLPPEDQLGSASKNVNQETNPQNNPANTPKINGEALHSNGQGRIRISGNPIRYETLPRSKGLLVTCLLCLPVFILVKTTAHLGLSVGLKRTLKVSTQVTIVTRSLFEIPPLPSNCDNPYVLAALDSTVPRQIRWPTSQTHIWLI